MHLFIDSKKEPSVYTNLFGKKIKRDFYNSRIAERMDGQFGGKLLLKSKKVSSDGFDGYVYKCPGLFGSEVHIYDNSVSSVVTPGEVAEAAEKVIARMGNNFVKRVYIANKCYAQEKDVNAIITKDIAILDGSRDLSKNQLDEILYIHGLCGLCDCAARQNDERNSPFSYETSTQIMMKKFYEEQKNGPSSIGKKEGWYFAYITEEIFKDKSFQSALASAEKIVGEIKHCAEGKDCTFAKTAMQYYKDQEGLIRDNYDYYLVMKRLAKLSYMEDMPRLVSKRSELSKIIFGDNGAKGTDIVKDDHNMILLESAKYLGEQAPIINDSNRKLPGEM